MMTFTIDHKAAKLSPIRAIHRRLITRLRCAPGDKPFRSLIRDNTADPAAVLVAFNELRTWHVLVIPRDVETIFVGAMETAAKAEVTGTEGSNIEWIQRRSNCPGVG